MVKPLAIYNRHAYSMQFNISYNLKFIDPVPAGGAVHNKVTEALTYLSV